MLRKVLLCSAVFGAVFAVMPSAHAAEPICVYVTVTAPVPKYEEECVPYIHDSDCTATGLNSSPYLAFRVEYCGPAAMPPDSP